MIECALMHIYDKIFLKVAKLMRKNIFILCLYLFIAYGSMGRMLFAEKTVGEWSFVLLVVTWILSLYLAIIPMIAPQIIKYLGIAIMQKMNENAKTYIKKTENELKRDIIGFRKVMNLLSSFILCPCFVSNMAETFVSVIYNLKIKNTKALLQRIVYLEDKRGFYSLDEKSKQKGDDIETLLQGIDEHGNIFLHIIARNGWLELLSTYAERCDVDLENVNGQTPYQLAVMYGWINCAKKLRQEYNCQTKEELLLMQILGKNAKMDSYQINNTFVCVGNIDVIGNCELIRGKYFYECKIYFHEIKEKEYSWNRA
eukprot:237148_1